MRHYPHVTSNPSTVPARLELDALIRYEMARLGLWRAICKRNPQLALFSEVYGDSPTESMGWSYSTSDRPGEPVHLTEQRQLTADSWNGEQGEPATARSFRGFTEHRLSAVSRWLNPGAEPQHAPHGVFPVAPIPPDAATGSAPYVTTSNGGQ